MYIRFPVDILLLPEFSCPQSYHAPKSPYKMQISQLWILITFFGWVLLHQILGIFFPFLPESNLELKRWALYYLRNFVL